MKHMSTGEMTLHLLLNVCTRPNADKDVEQQEFSTFSWQDANESHFGRQIGWFLLALHNPATNFNIYIRCKKLTST